jgi:phospholipase/carboxylesterase
LQPSELGLYHVTRPPKAGGAGPHPGLLLLHGRGANELDLVGLADELDSRFFVVSARAPMALGPGYHWYHLAAIGIPEPKSFESSLAAVSRFVSELPSAYPIDPAAIFTLGFSQGSMMAGSLLLTHPTSVAGTVVLSGYLPLASGLPIDEAALAGRPVFEAHGTADQVLPVFLGRQARDFWQKVGADLTYREYPIAHSISPAELLDVGEWLTRRLVKP